MRAIIFAHYDQDAIVDPHVHFSIACYRKVFDHVSFVSASLKELPKETKKNVDHFIARENIGYDFGSWRDGLLQLQLDHQDRFDEVCLVNDSVYGPLFDLEPSLSYGQRNSFDAWGMVSSYQTTRKYKHRGEPHLQSWFLGISRRALRHPGFIQFWGELSPQRDKASIIRNCEIQFSRSMIQEGLKLGSRFDASKLSVSEWLQMLRDVSVLEPFRSFRLIKRSLFRTPNPTELFWKPLWDAGVPYVKISMFKHNPHGIRLDRVLTSIERDTDYDPGLIRNHLARVSK